MSTMAISSATRTGWRRLATGFPRINSRAVLVSRAKRGEHQRCRRINAGRGLVVLIEHDLHTLVLSHQPFVDVTVVERGALLRVVNAIGQGDADRFVFLRGRQIGIGILAEVPRLHDLAPDVSAACAACKKRNTFTAVAVGCSTCGRWPASAMVSVRACGMSAA